MVRKIMGWDSDGTSEHEEWFEGSRRIVYKESVVGVGGFPFLLSFLIMLYSKASYDFETGSTSDLSWIPWNKYRAFSPVLRHHIIVINITYVWPCPLHLYKDELGFHQVERGFCPLHCPGPINYPSDWLQHICCIKSPAMWASPESLHHLVSVVQLATEIFCMKG
jgi:hypothetical protein